MDRSDRRAATLLFVLAVGLTPVALAKPDFGGAVEDWLELAAVVVLRPGLLFGEVRAAERGASAAELRARADLDRRISAQVAAGRDLLEVRVIGYGGRGGAGRPDELLLDGIWGIDAARRLAGRPVVVGEDLCGFVAPEGSQFDGRLRVDLVNSRRRRRVMPRLALEARSRVAPDAPRLRLLVEAATPRASNRLRVLRAVPWHLDTWSRRVRPYLAYTAKSERLHPDLPAGLVVGRCTAIGYSDRSFVLQRFVEPRFDARELVRVAILGPRDVTPPPATQRRHSTRGVSVAWRPPAPTAARSYVLRGRGLQRGALVSDGLGAVGVVVWARGGLALARPIDAPGRELVAVWHAAAGPVRPLVLSCRGRRAGHVVFRVVRPAATPADLAGGVLDSGGGGRLFPFGFRIGSVAGQDGALIEVDLEGDLEWPEAVAVPDPEGGA